MRQPWLVLLLALLIAAFIGGVWASRAESFTGSQVTWKAGNAQAALCGTGLWWRCRDAWAPKAKCYGRGRGEWECYGGITEQGDPAFWKWRNCRFYFWINSWNQQVKRRIC